MRKCTPKICVDIDNVLAATDSVMREVIRKVTNGLVCLDYDDVQEFDYDKCQDKNNNSITREQWSVIHNLFAERESLLSIQLLPGAEDGLRRLSNFASLDIVTTRLPKARISTIEWLQQFKLPSYNLHFVSHLEKHLAVGNVYLAIDDHYEQAKCFADTGVDAILLRHPWNRDKPRIDRLEWADDWGELTEKVLQKLQQR